MGQANDISHLDPHATESIQLTPLRGIFYGQVPIFQYFTQTKTDQPRRNSFTAKILRGRSENFFNPDQSARRRRGGN
jgi:hypothetical protein